MSVNHVDFVNTRLLAPLKSTDLVMKLQPVRGLRDKLNRLPIGDYVYLVLQMHSVIEVVKYTHTAELPTASAITLAIERGQHNTTATSFSFGSCVRSEFTKSVFDELLAHRLEQQP